LDDDRPVFRFCIASSSARLFLAHLNEDRPHMGLDGDAPITRAVEPRELGKVVALPWVGGLHHRYVRRAA